MPFSVNCELQLVLVKRIIHEMKIKVVRKKLIFYCIAPKIDIPHGEGYTFKAMKECARFILAARRHERGFIELVNMKHISCKIVYHFTGCFIVQQEFQHHTSLELHFRFT